MWLVSLLLLITHAHPLFVVSESIIANHTCTSLVRGYKFVFCTNHEIHENIPFENSPL